MHRALLIAALLVPAAASAQTPFATPASIEAVDPALLQPSADPLPDGVRAAIVTAVMSHYLPTPAPAASDEVRVVWRVYLDRDGGFWRNPDLVHPAGLDDYVHRAVGVSGLMAIYDAKNAGDLVFDPEAYDRWRVVDLEVTSRGLALPQ